MINKGAKAVMSERSNRVAFFLGLLMMESSLYVIGGLRSVAWGILFLGIAVMWGALVGDIKREEKEQKATEERRLH